MKIKMTCTYEIDSSDFHDFDKLTDEEIIKKINDEQDLDSFYYAYDFDTLKIKGEKI